MRRIPLLMLLLLAAAPVAEARAPVAPSLATERTTPQRTPWRPARNPAADPSLVSPSLQRLARPRHEAGGSQCRSACSRSYYFCLAEGGYSCGVEWSQCLAACPGGSSAR
jgi:hypothetical protein